MISQYFIGKYTIISVNYGVGLHGHVSSKNFVDNFPKAGITISYADVQLVYGKWALKNITESMKIPCEIACNVPTFCIAGNFDFKVDTLIGNS